MKKIVKLFFLLALAGSVHAQDYWQQKVNYSIDVNLDPSEHILKGKLDLYYYNQSPDTLNFIWFHLWPNAYSGSNTALAKQLKNKKDAQLILLGKDSGYIRDLDFRVNEKNARLEPDATNPDMAKLILASPLLPHDSIRIQTPFTVKLPPYFSRSGYSGEQYMVCQWYPKPAVYDKDGWHPIPYLDQGEFYSEFGSYRVNITLPSKYIVGATGVMHNEGELSLYRKIGTRNLRDTLHPTFYVPLNDSLKTLNYNADSVHDFAWFADTNFIIQYDTLSVVPGKTIDVFSYYQPDGNELWKRSTSFIKDAVRHYSDWIGDYPYPTVAAVEGPRNQSSGGMEYPMITLITSPDADAEALDAVITHEVGHNWFYSILGSNERLHPWMDEGMNTYFEFLYEAVKYRANSVFGASLPLSFKSLGVDQFLGNIYFALNTLPMEKPVNTESTGFRNEEEYSMVAYLKTATWMHILESAIGKEAFMKGIHEYYKQWKFRHPAPGDLQKVFEEVTGQSLDNIFELLNKRGNFK